MKRASFARAALAVMMLLATAVGVSAQGEANLQRRVSVNVNAVSPRQVLEMIARAVDCTLALDPKVTTPVTIRVSRVTARTVLNVVCESVGCHWRLDGQTLRVGVEQPAATDAPSSQEGKPRLSDPLPSGERVYVIGNGVTGPALVKQVNPSYTSAAMKAKVQGQVDVQFVVLRDGTVAEVKVTRKLSPELDEQAVAAVRQWVFTPGQLDGRSVAVRCEAQLAFNLRDREPSPDSDVALECEIAKDGQVVARPTLRIAKGNFGTVTYRDELSVQVRPERLDARHVRIALDVGAAGRTIRPELKLAEGGEAGTVMFPAGTTTFSLKFALPK
jgi:TonB family protein